MGLYFHRKGETGQKLWNSIVTGVREGSLNLDLYLNKYLLMDGTKIHTGSPSQAKVAAMELLRNIRRFGINTRLTKGEGAPQVPIGQKVIEEYRRYHKLHSKLAEITFDLKTTSRLVVGLDEGGTYETGITLLRNYGVPYIPGTALKGVAKHYAVEKLVKSHWFKNGKFREELFDGIFEEETERLAGKYRKDGKKFNEDVYGAMEVTMLALEEESNEEKGEPPKEFLNWEISLNGETITVSELRKIFGTKAKEGSVVFLDALPDPNNLENILEWDIMNPHYSPYYQRNEVPGDWHNPTPIKFLVVKPDVRFLFRLRKAKTCTGNCDGLLTKAEALLMEALKNHGVGAKTALGYGRFDVP
ncbi:type III-B CRISPR module RAMP protein Cmr6 [Thermococcus sp. 18S1]|uniref:type III-B CRISPR module RAMP protein Cmr6 n=1 Tax=Thermococcus sp. 18S1 TaxID=1638210 RepID=UPI001439D6EB|nr:type III-B CRISPR module RAMP protein Cmr6 [Thermococcus sp. 18S1]